MKELACGVEDAKALRRRIAPPVHLARKLKRVTQIGEPALFPIGHATATRLALAPRNKFYRVVWHASPRPQARMGADVDDCNAGRAATRSRLPFAPLLGVTQGLR